MEIVSSAFKDGEKIPTQYVMPGAGGKNISVPLSWKNTPSGTKSFALSVVDPHPVAQNWVHWLVINIPANVTFLEEGASMKKLPQGSMEGYTNLRLSRCSNCTSLVSGESLAPSRGSLWGLRGVRGLIAADSGRKALL